MNFALRKIERRGRSVVPRSRSRIRSWRLRRSASRECLVIMWSFRSDLAGLACLAQDLLARIADPLALVGLRLALLADVGRGLSDQLLVGAEDGEPRR